MDRVVDVHTHMNTPVQVLMAKKQQLDANLFLKIRNRIGNVYNNHLTQETSSISTLK